MHGEPWAQAFQQFLEEPGELRHAVGWARANGALPIDEDGGFVVGLTRDGRVLAHHYEPFPGQVPADDREITDPALKSQALAAGARRYAWLKAGT